MAKNSDFNDFMDFTKKSLGLDEDTANRFAEDLSRNFGGDELYINNQIQRINRDKTIRSQYNGMNCDELSKQFSLSKRQIFNIVRS